MNNDKKTALVLGAGGLRGSYQVGVIKALEEMNIEYDIVVGSSIGSLNGAALVQGYTADELVQLWTNIEESDVYIKTSTGNEFYDKVLEKLYTMPKIGDLAIILRGLIKGSYDNTPYKNLVRTIIDPEKVMASDKEFGLGTISFTFLKYMELTKNDMKRKKGDICDYIIASSSAFPVFPAYKIGLAKYIDGGYKDSLPIDFARKLGAERIIAVDINSMVTHEDEMNSEDAIYLYGENLGTFLDFNQETIQSNIIKGYEDTIRKFSGL